MFFTWRVPRWLLLVIFPAAAGMVWAIATFGAERSGAILPTPRVGTLLSPMHTVTFRFPIRVVEATVTTRPEIEGVISIDGDSVAFRPVEPMRPGSTYEFLVSASQGDERISDVFAYSVMPLADALWVYVKLDRIPHEVFVYHGDQQVRRMTASGGRPGDETPEGTFRIQNRGYHFFSQKYGEGAYYWVRIFGNYLFHSIPVDIEGKVIQEEAEKLGCPASHGCVRLSFEDAEWFYENVPDGALVVIDRT